MNQLNAALDRIEKEIKLGSVITNQINETNQLLSKNSKDLEATTIAFAKLLAHNP